MLDAVAQAQIWRFLVTQTKKRDVGLVFVSHSPALAERIATRTIDLGAAVFFSLLRRALPTVEVPRIPSTWAQRASDLLRKASPTAKASPKAAVAPCHAAGSRVGPSRLPRRPLQTPREGVGCCPARGAEDNFFRICESHRLAEVRFRRKMRKNPWQKPRRCAATTRISGKNCRNHACPCADARRNLSKPAETAVKTAPKPAETRPAAPKPSDTVQPLAVPPYRRTAEPPYRRITPRLAENRATPLPSRPAVPVAAEPCAASGLWEHPSHAILRIARQALFVHMRGSALTSRRQFIGAARHIYPPTGINFL